MTRENRHELAEREVLYTLPEAHVGPTVVRTFPGDDGDPLATELYYPAAANSTASTVPAVVLVCGYPGEGMRKMLGCRFREMGSTVSWAKLIAASGLAAVTYDNTQPEADLIALLKWLDRNGESLGIDRARIGLWASSGNVPLALSLLTSAHPFVSFAACLYGYTVDRDDSTLVKEAADAFRFVAPFADPHLENIRRDAALCLVRAGGDAMPGLNAALDRFVTAALARNLDLTLINVPSAVHAFDLFDDGKATAGAVEAVLRFLQQRAGLGRG
ncbi:MAG TPA: hypothetical protein VJP86_16220 [Vicinamibacterales bacterium]|nr:hypothetical protein [Vicinamibacterales bacterium]